MSAIGALVLAMPAQAVQVSFSGSNLTTTGQVTGADPLGNTWITRNVTAGVNSSFTMADAVETPQAFNSANFSNGLALSPILSN